VFSAGMKIVKNLENTIWQCFWRLFNKVLWIIYAYLRHLESYYCILRWILCIGRPSFFFFISSKFQPCFRDSAPLYFQGLYMYDSDKRFS
jgi:hypothetical protein